MTSVISLLLLCNAAWAYNDYRGHNLDSLERAVARWTPDEVDRASTDELVSLNNAYRELMLGYNQMNPEKSLFYARKALEISAREGWAYSNADAHRYIGQHFWAREQYDSALVYFEKARENVEHMEAGATSPTRPEGYSQLDIDDMRSALYGATGNLYNEMGDIPRAMQYYSMAGEIFDRYGWNVSNAVLYYNIGETWLDEGDYKAAKDAYEKSLEYAVSADDSLWIAVGRKGLGRLWLEQGKYGKALRCLREADQYFALHDMEETASRKETFDYMTQALHKQRQHLLGLLCGAGAALLLALAAILLSRRRRKGQAESAKDRPSPETPAPETSGRENEILDLLSKGYTTPQIADALNLSPETVKWYRKRLLVKFDVANTAELVLKAKETGLL